MMRLPNSLQAFWKRLKTKNGVSGISYDPGIRNLRRARRARLSLEQLEDRVTPTALDLAGSLAGSNTFIVDVTSSGGIMATVNGITNSYNPGAYDAIDISPGPFFSTNVNVYIYNTNVPISVAPGGLDYFFSVGNSATGVQGINGTVDLTHVSSTAEL